MPVRLETEIDQIWADDLLGRRAEAEMLEAYLESIVGRQNLRHDGKVYTVAVDAGYGEGKTFFLRRLAQHLGTRHPVAFVDAWADDIVDEPLTALAATLKRSLKPLLESSGPVRSQWQGVLEKTGAIAGIAAKGIFKRGLGLLITSGAVEAADEVLAGVGGAAAAAVKDDLKSSGKDAMEGVAATVSVTTPPPRMEARIAEFEEGKAAVKSLRDSLSALIAILENQPLVPPIVIVVDELDRCRPSYAVKLLEEIKHLFDVPGLVFIFGMHGQQLAHSIVGAYGPGFDGRAYLRRFINREYRLKPPDLTPLIARLLESSKLDFERMLFPPVPTGRNTAAPLPPPVMIARYMHVYGLAPRDAFQVVDMLQTSLALTKTPLIMAYLLPLIFGRMRGLASGTLPEAVKPGALQFRLISSLNDQITDIWPAPLAERLANAAAQTSSQLINTVNNDEGDVPSLMILETRTEGRTAKDVLSDPASYPELLDAVGRFTNPGINGEDDAPTG